jgi:hypothetical protein
MVEWPRIAVDRWVVIGYTVLCYGLGGRREGVGSVRSNGHFGSSMGDRYLSVCGERDSADALRTHALDTEGGHCSGIVRA